MHGYRRLPSPAELDAMTDLSPEVKAIRRESLADNASMVEHARDRFSLVNDAIAAHLKRDRSVLGVRHASTDRVHSPLLAGCFIRG